MTDYSKPYDGGPVYPIRDMSIRGNSDKSLRDYFAGQALPAVYEGYFESTPREGETWWQMVARDSWMIADANIATIWRVKLGSWIVDREELCGFFSDAHVTAAEARLMERWIENAAYNEWVTP